MKQKRMTCALLAVSLCLCTAAFTGCTNEEKTTTANLSSSQEPADEKDCCKDKGGAEANDCCKDKSDDASIADVPDCCGEG